MKIAIYGRSINDDCITGLLNLFSILNENKIESWIFRGFAEYLSQLTIPLPANLRMFENEKEIDSSIKYMLSIGGDGTFLEAISLIRDKQIPVIGMNTGRLGFLANITKEDIAEAMDDILQQRFNIEERTLLEIQGADVFMENPWGLNEFTLQKTGSSMVTIHAYINNELLNSYWADGLIVSTPTGSTAYSMSAGGPIVSPSSPCLIISPLAAHNLSIRPVIIPDTATLVLTAESRQKTILASLDNRSYELKLPVRLTLQKAPFCLKTVRLQKNSFYSTLRNKLLWGVDKRN